MSLDFLLFFPEAQNNQPRPQRRLILASLSVKLEQFKVQITTTRIVFSISIHSPSPI